jgi:hypothetical protein
MIEIPMTIEFWSFALSIVVALAGVALWFYRKIQRNDEAKAEVYRLVRDDSRFLDAFNELSGELMHLRENGYRDELKVAIRQLELAARAILGHVSGKFSLSERRKNQEALKISKSAESKLFSGGVTSHEENMQMISNYLSATKRTITILEQNKESEYLLYKGGPLPISGLRNPLKMAGWN